LVSLLADGFDSALEVAGLEVSAPSAPSELSQAVRRANGKSQCNVSWSAGTRRSSCIAFFALWAFSRVAAVLELLW
jgi:hypothetical protein